MKLIIDIDENPREQIIDIANNGLNVPIGLENIMIMAIANGTPLPKGHGRLIDADAYIASHAECGWLDDITVDEFNKITPTIIPATKEGGSK